MSIEMPSDKSERDKIRYFPLVSTYHAIKCDQSCASLLIKRTGLFNNVAVNPHTHALVGVCKRSLAGLFVRMSVHDSVDVTHSISLSLTQTQAVVRDCGWTAAVSGLYACFVVHRDFWLLLRKPILCRNTTSYC